MVMMPGTAQPAVAATTGWRGRVALVAKPGGPTTGVGRYVHMLQGGLCAAGVDVVRVAPTTPALPRRRGLDARAFLLNYPVWARYPRADVYHLTAQNLASLLLFRRPRGRVLVTVHDIIPYLLRQDPELCPYRTAADRLFDRLAMAGLGRADLLIADSHYTRHCVIDRLGIAPEKIVVVYLGIDHGRFRPLPVGEMLRERYQLPEGRRYLIYVGSEDRRKNLATLVRALDVVRRGLPGVELIKVGRPHVTRERQRLLDLADELGVQSAIHFLDEVPEGTLPLLYNLADVCVMPSLYEGFGLPALEAMACGTPVVAARATSLPELIGDAGLLCELGPNAVMNLAGHLHRLLTDQALATTLRRRGLARSHAFTWSRTVHHMRDLYGHATDLIPPSAGYPTGGPA